jgi:cystathionine beta-lyase/cystathionine gamma-synthase
MIVGNKYVVGGPWPAFRTPWPCNYKNEFNHACLPVGRNEHEEKEEKMKRNNCSMRTFLIHGKFKTKKWDYNHHIVPPLSSSSAYRLISTARGKKGFEKFLLGKFDENLLPIYIYDRLDEPTRGMLEEILAKAEEGEYAVTFSSGMAAISAACGIFINQNDEILAHKTLYGCTYSLFTNWYPKYNVKVRFVDMTNIENVRNNMSKNTKIIYFETPANPTLEVIDISSIVSFVKEWNKKNKTNTVVIVDNTFATPFCQRPISLGVDVVVVSLTKGISGFGTDIGGAVITRKEFIPSLFLYRKDFGGALSPKVAWHILVYGLSSLPIRIKEQMKSAYKIAKFLENHKKVEYVSYPGLDSFPQKKIAEKQMRDYNGEFAPGTMIYFTLKDGRKAGKFLDYIAKNSYAITLAVSLGQIRTLIESPALMTHSSISSQEQKSVGISEAGIRISVGLEDVEDIIKDLDSAFNAI